MILRKEAGMVTRRKFPHSSYQSHPKSRSMRRRNDLCCAVGMSNSFTTKRSIYTLVCFMDIVLLPGYRVNLSYRR